MPRIAVLDDNMINMIAAGEVIERPASVVKELLENCIDAGATKIVVEVEQGGRDLIRIIDDGSGMDADDLRLAFEPHATSKIHSSDDLAAIRTMGFRGEALASIGSVAKVTVTSRTADSIEANTITIDCGEKFEVRPCSGDYGTTIEVRNLFYKLPARRKFLRTPNTEMTHISEHFTRIALAYTNLDLTLRHNGRETYRLLRGQGVKERISILFNKSVSEDLLATERVEHGMEIRALLGLPTGARSNSHYQYLFLNKRFIRDKFILHAVKEAYRGLLEPSKYPVVFLFIEMPPESYDVNVHPTKVEVRFDNSNLVHSAVLAVLRDKLLSTNLDAAGTVPGIQSGDMGNVPAIPQGNDVRRERIQQAMADFFKKPASSHQQRFSFSTPSSGTKFPDVSSGLGGLPEFSSPQEFDKWHAKDFLQIHNSYILIQSEEGFMVVDQHALHERILYEQMCRKLNESNLPSQRLLTPHSFEVTPAQWRAYEAQKDLFAKLGIELEPFGPETLAVQTFPVLLEKLDPVEFVKDALDKIVDEESSKTDQERLVHEVLDMASCKAAVKAGDPLTDQEIAQLLKDKEVVHRTSRCPHGRPTTITFSIKELEKQFKRTGF